MRLTALMYRMYECRGRQDAGSGAALDVFPTEPKVSDEEFVSPLRDFDKVILAPRVGGSTEEAQHSIGLEVAEKLVRFNANGSTLSAVNFPEVVLPPHLGTYRLLHIHRNQPGVMASVNAMFSESGRKSRFQATLNPQSYAKVLIFCRVLHINGHGLS